MNVNSISCIFKIIDKQYLFVINKLELSNNNNLGGAYHESKPHNRSDVRRCFGYLTGFWVGSGTGMDLSAYLIQAGEGLRALSISGFWGNLAAWALVLALAPCLCCCSCCPGGAAPLP